MNTQQSSFHLNLLTSAKVLIVLRVSIITLFLGSVLVFQSTMEKSTSILPITLIIIVTYLLTICYAISLPRIKNLRRFCYIQTVGDLIIETTVIFVTGGIESVFSFLYILSIISASITLARPANFIIATIASILYGSTTYIEFSKGYNFLFSYSNSTPDGLYFVYKTFLNISAFFLVAYLSDYLGEQWRATGKKLEEKSENLIELQAFHKNIVKSMSSGLITTDLDGQITSFNSAAEYITEFTLPEVMNLSLYSFFPFIDQSDLFQHMTRKEKNIFRAEGYFKKKNHKTIYIGISISSLKDGENNAKGLIITFQDLTSMKEMEEKVARAERFAAIGQISAGIAHEIRNPLASMSGSIQVLKDELTLDGSNKQLMDIVLKETDRLNSIITQFLNYASPRPITLHPCDISELIKETIILLKNSKEYNKNIDIISMFQENITLNIDRNQMKQVFINLCLNSFHAMGENGYLIISSCYCKTNPAKADSKKQYVKITFTDNGEGMSKTTLYKVFDPFYTTKEKGTGLGLAVVYRIIEKHQGLIDITSQEGKGTSIGILLPIQDMA